MLSRDLMKRSIQSFTISSRKELFYWGGGVVFNPSHVGKLDCCSSHRPRHNLVRQRRPAHNGSISPPRRDSPLIYGERRGSGRWKDLPRHCISSRLSSATVEDAPGEKDVNGEPSTDEVHCSQPIGMRPATAPASTPLDLGCKAYYMARTIDLKTVRSVSLHLSRFTDTPLRSQESIPCYIQTSSLLRYLHVLFFAHKLTILLTTYCLCLQPTTTLLIRLFPRSRSDYTRVSPTASKSTALSSALLTLTALTGAIRDHGITGRAWGKCYGNSRDVTAPRGR